MMATRGDRASDRYGRAPPVASARVGQDSPVGEESTSRLEDMNRILGKDQCGCPVTEIRVHSDHPGPHRLGRFPFYEELHDLESLTETLLGIGVRRTLSPGPLADSLRIADAGDRRHQTLAQHVLERLDDRRYRQTNRPTMNYLLQCHVYLCSQLVCRPIIQHLKCYLKRLSTGHTWTSV